MPRIFSLIALCLLFVFGEAFAQEELWDEAEEEARFETCYSNNAGADVVSKCQYIQTCVNGSRDNSTSRGMTECALQGYKLWDAKLNLEYQALQKVTSRVYGADAGIALREAQIAWISFRDKECYAIQERSNVVLGAVHKGCMARITAERTAQLGEESSRLNLRWPE